MDIKRLHVKAVGILLMLLGHAVAHASDYRFLHDCIYIFHMPFCSSSPG